MGDYRAPLFLAWQLTNACGCRCLHCCEESGPDKGWKDELTREQALEITKQIVDLGIAYVAFGGGEPLGVPHVWEVFEALCAGGVDIKIETNGLLIDERAAERLKGLDVASIQISVDGASAAVHEKVRPDGSFSGAVSALKRLAQRGLEPELVFVPTKYNIGDACAVYDLAVQAGARVFVTGPMMRLGRAAAAWDSLAPSKEQWSACVRELKAREGIVKLSIYPWEIQEEIRVRTESPQSMLLVVPNGRVKLLNALPFAPADLKKDSLASAWKAVQEAWRNPKVVEFNRKAVSDTSLLRHANECWDVALTVPGSPVV